MNRAWAVLGVEQSVAAGYLNRTSWRRGETVLVLLRMLRLESLQGFLLFQHRLHWNDFPHFLACPLCHQPMDLQLLEEVECLGHLFIIIHRHDHNPHLIIVGGDDPMPMPEGQVSQQKAIILSLYG